MPGRGGEAEPEPMVFIAHSDPEIVAGWFGNGLRAAGLRLTISTSGSELLERFDPDVPSCTLLELLLPPSGGLDVLAKLRGRRPSAPVLMIGEAPTARVAVEAMRLGAADVLEAAFDPHLLQMKILQLAEQDSRSILAEQAHADRCRRVRTLSPRERQVLDHVLQGRSSKEIARILEVSPKAIEIYRAGMMRKLGQRSSVVMARWLSLCSRCLTASPACDGCGCKDIGTDPIGSQAQTLGIAPRWLSETPQIY